MSAEVRCGSSLHLVSRREQFWVKRVTIQKVIQDLFEVSLVFFQHLLRLIQRIIAVAQDIDQPGMEDAILKSLNHDYLNWEYIILLVPLSGNKFTWFFVE